MIGKVLFVLAAITFIWLALYQRRTEQCDVTELPSADDDELELVNRWAIDSQLTDRAAYLSCSTLHYLVDMANLKNLIDQTTPSRDYIIPSMTREFVAEAVRDSVLLIAGHCHTGSIGHYTTLGPAATSTYSTFEAAHPQTMFLYVNARLPEPALRTINLLVPNRSPAPGGDNVVVIDPFEITCHCRLTCVSSVNCDHTVSSFECTPRLGVGEKIIISTEVSAARDQVVAVQVSRPWYLDAPENTQLSVVVDTTTGSTLDIGRAILVVSNFSSDDDDTSSVRCPCYLTLSCINQIPNGHCVLVMSHSGGIWPAVAITVPCSEPGLRSLSVTYLLVITAAVPNEFMVMADNTIETVVMRFPAIDWDEVALRSRSIFSMPKHARKAAASSGEAFYTLKLPTPDSMDYSTSVNRHMIRDIPSGLLRSVLSARSNMTVSLSGNTGFARPHLLKVNDPGVIVGLFRQLADQEIPVYVVTPWAIKDQNITRVFDYSFVHFVSLTEFLAINNATALGPTGRVVIMLCRYGPYMSHDLRGLVLHVLLSEDTSKSVTLARPGLRFVSEIESKAKVHLRSHDNSRCSLSVSCTPPQTSTCGPGRVRIVTPKGFVVIFYLAADTSTVSAAGMAFLAYQVASANNEWVSGIMLSRPTFADLAGLAGVPSIEADPGSRISQPAAKETTFPFGHHTLNYVSRVVGSVSNEMTDINEYEISEIVHEHLAQLQNRPLANYYL